MLTYEEALSNLLSRVPRPAPEEVPLSASLGRALAEQVAADLDLPPFDKSSMDGYAVRSVDLPDGGGRLEVAGQAAAGAARRERVGPGQAFKIMTGAPVPVGADAVQMVEVTRQTGSTVEILEPVQPGQNVAARGSEVERGSVVLEPGRVVGPPEIGVLATFGRSSVKVFKAPSAVVVSTGDELVEISRTPQFGQIRNSNAHMLWAQCRRMGLEARIHPIVGDDPKDIEKAIGEGLRSDLLIFSGGVSMGEFDYVHKALAKADVEIFFHKAAIKPGKPLIVGRCGDRMVFGLPGNPVSSFVTFEIFLKPAVRKWMGWTNLGLPKVSARLMTDVRQKPGRLFFKPANTRFGAAGFECAPFETKGSADIVAFARADSMMLFPSDAAHIAAGSQVEVLLLEDRGGWASVL